MIFIMTSSLVTLPTKTKELLSVHELSTYDYVLVQLSMAFEQFHLFKEFLFFFAPSPAFTWKNFPYTTCIVNI